MFITAVLLSDIFKQAQTFCYHDNILGFLPLQH